MTNVKDTLEDTPFTFIDNPAIRDRPDQYLCINVNTVKVLKSWRLSLFAHEWLSPEGMIKPAPELPSNEQSKRATVEEIIRQGKPLEMPVLGIGLQDNIEIGSGKAVFLTLSVRGKQNIPVHIPKSHREDFAPFLS